MKKSPIDELFFELYGHYPNKAGQAYEMLVSAAFKLVFDKDISYDQRLRGVFSNSVYQLDGLIKDDSKQAMVEAKDYTFDKRKVGRGDLQKLQGALTDLSVENGVFASATGFTMPASKYANGLEKNPASKGIELFDIRPSTDVDEEGRIKKITINSTMHMPQYERGNYQPIFTNKGLMKAEQNGIVNRSVEMRLEHFYDQNRNVLLTMMELTSKHPPMTTWEKDFVAKACWIIDGYFEIEAELYQIKGIQYEIPYFVASNQIVIEGGGNPKIYVKSHSGNIDKLITDKELKKVKFENGRVII